MTAAENLVNEQKHTTRKTNIQKRGSLNRRPEGFNQQAYYRSVSSFFSERSTLFLFITMNDNNSNNKRNRRFVIRDYKGTVPIFFQSEIHLDRMLGQGSFCAAWTIQQVHLCDDERSKTLPNQENRRSLADQLNEARKSHGKAPLLRCVVKKPRNDFYANVHNGDQSLTDLRYELKLLHRVGMGQHPNIIQLHGIGASLIENDKEKPQQPGVTFKLSFLILSRIRYTIEELMVKWRDQRGPGVKQALAIDQNTTHQVWKERMSVLAQVADALRYLHSNRIILRDLKPENVGQDYHGVVKVYDLGLATQIEKENHGIDKLFRLTGNTGTLRYMSPEIGNRKSMATVLMFILWPFLCMKFCPSRCPLPVCHQRLIANESIIKGSGPHWMEVGRNRYESCYKACGWQILPNDPMLWRCPKP